MCSTILLQYVSIKFTYNYDEHDNCMSIVNYNPEENEIKVRTYIILSIESRHAFFRHAQQHLISHRTPKPLPACGPNKSSSISQSLHDDNPKAKVYINADQMRIYTSDTHHYFYNSAFFFFFFFLISLSSSYSPPTFIFLYYHFIYFFLHHLKHFIPDSSLCPENLDEDGVLVYIIYNNIYVNIYVYGLAGCGGIVLGPEGFGFETLYNWGRVAHKWFPAFSVIIVWAITGVASWGRTVCLLLCLQPKKGDGL